MANGRINGSVSQRADSYSYYIDWQSEPNTNSCSSLVKAWAHISCSKHNASHTSCAQNLYINGVHFTNTLSVNLSPGVDIMLVYGEVVVPHNNDGTQAVTISASSSLPSGNGWGPASGSASATVALDTIPRYANLTGLSVINRTVDSITIGYSTDREARLFAKLDSTSWLNNGQPFVDNTKSGSFTIYYKNRENTERLDPNVDYGITVLCRSVQSGLDTSVRIVATTKDIARISSVSNVDFGENVNINFTNLANGTTKLIVKIGNEQICERSNLTSSYVLEFTKEELSEMIKFLKAEETQITYIVITDNKYTATRTATMTLKASLYIKRNGEWIKAKLYKKEQSWKLTRLFFKVNGVWRNTR